MTGKRWKNSWNWEVEWNWYASCCRKVRTERASSQQKTVRSQNVGVNRTGKSRSLEFFERFDSWKADSLDEAPLSEALEQLLPRELLGLLGVWKDACPCRHGGEVESSCTSSDSIHSDNSLVSQNSVSSGEMLPRRSWYANIYIYTTISNDISISTRESCSLQSGLIPHVHGSKIISSGNWRFHPKIALPPVYWLLHSHPVSQKVWKSIWFHHAGRMTNTWKTQGDISSISITRAPHQSLLNHHTDQLVLPKKEVNQHQDRRSRRSNLVLEGYFNHGKMTTNSINHQIWAGSPLKSGRASFHLHEPSEFIFQFS